MKAAVLISHDVESGSCVIGVPNQRGGLTELQLDPPYSSPQFLPEVGQEVLLQMDGPVPRVFPQRLGVDSVGLAEVAFGTVTALLLQGDQIIAGDPDGNHVVIDVLGVRLIRDGVDIAIDLQTETGDGLFTGVIQTAVNGYRLRLWPSDDDGSRIDFLTPATAVGDEFSPSPQTARIFTAAVGDGEQELTVQAGVSTGVSNQGALFLDPAGVASLSGMQVDLSAFGGGSALRVRTDATGSRMYGAGAVLRIEVNGTGIGFYGTTPVAKPAVTGSRGGNAALASLLTALASQGLITDSSTA